MSGRPVHAAIACAFIGLCIGYVMIPGQNEQLAMLSRDGQPEAALEMADELFDSGNRQPAIVLQAFVLNQNAGKYERGLEAFRAYFQMQPDDAAAWQKAAEIFDAQGQIALMNEALENVVRLTRSPAAAIKLAGYYRLVGRLDKELRVLQAVEAKDLPSPAALRLSKLLFDQKLFAGGAAILERLDDTDPKLPDSWRVQLFVALIEQGKFDAAADRAIKWNSGKKDSPLRDVLAGYLLIAGADKAALRLVGGPQTFADASEFVRVTGLLADQGRLDLVEQLLGQWLAVAGQMPADSLDSYFQEVVSLSGGKGLAAKLFNELSRSLSKGLDASVQASFVQAMYGQFGYAGVAPFRRAIRPEVFRLRPVLAARLMAAEGNRLAARRFLFAAHLPHLSARAQFDWLGLAQEILSAQELGDVLARRAQAGAIPPELQKAVLDVLINVDMQPQMAVAWQAFFGPGNPGRLH